MQRLTRWFLILPLKYLLRIMLRAAVTTLIFSIVVAVTMRWLGHPMPSFSDLENYFERLAELSSILS